MARQIAMRETGYSDPLASESSGPGDRWNATASRHATSRLKFGGAHLADPAAQRNGDVILRAVPGAPRLALHRAR